jgi:hypothetical protein
MSWGKGPLRGIRRLSDTIGGGSVTPTYTTTVITSSTTFVAGPAGVYRIMCLGSGGTGSGTNGQRGAGSAIPVYAEVTLTAAQNVTVTIAAGRAGINQQYGGTPGNATSFGTLVVGPGGTPGGDPNPGPGWAGGGDAGAAGGTLGNAGGGPGGAGAGSELLAFLQAQFADVTLASGTAGAAASSGSGGGGGAGLLVNASGPSGSSAAANKGGRGSGYGGASGGRGDGSNAETSNVGVMLIGVPS